MDVDLIREKITTKTKATSTTTQRLESDWCVSSCAGQKGEAPFSCNSKYNHA